MTRRTVYTIKDIYKRRAWAWEFHYGKRETVKIISPGLDVPQILTVITNLMPSPELLIDGTLLRGMPHIEATHAILEKLRWGITQRELLCVWYWSAEGWQEFVRAFQALPDVYENYLYTYDSAIDALRFAPRGESQGKVGGKSGTFPKKGGKSRVGALVENSFPK